MLEFLKKQKAEATKSDKVTKTITLSDHASRDLFRIQQLAEEAGQPLGFTEALRDALRVGSYITEQIHHGVHVKIVGEDGPQNVDMAVANMDRSGLPLATGHPKQQFSLALSPKSAEDLETYRQMSYRDDTSAFVSEAITFYRAILEADQNLDNNGELVLQHPDGREERVNALTEPEPTTPSP